MKQQSKNPNIIRKITIGLGGLFLVTALGLSGSLARGGDGTRPQEVADGGDGTGPRGPKGSGSEPVKPDGGDGTGPRFKA